MDFKERINELEIYSCDEDFLIRKGTLPILFSAPHTILQTREDQSIKKAEPYTKAISLYMNKYHNTYSIVKMKDTGKDPNWDNNDSYKNELIKIVKENDIKLVIDIHGASKDREFDVEFGTCNNLTTDIETLKLLENSFNKNGITNINYNDPFKGGAITQTLFYIKEVNAIQIEINGKYRDYTNLELLEKIINSFELFIEEYKKYI